MDIPEQTTEPREPRRYRTIGEEVYVRLRGDVLSGRFEPGARLYSEALMGLYGCGISPLREALSRLSSERLVIGTGQKGFQVAPVSLDEMWDITRTRQIVETAALRDSIANGDSDWEERIVANFHSLSKAPLRDAHSASPDEWEFRHRRFHAALVSACTSPWLLHIVGLLYNHSERYRRLRLAQTERAKLKRNLAAEHKRLMEAVLDRDVERAAAMLSDHLNRTADFMSSYLE